MTPPTPPSSHEKDLQVINCLLDDLARWDDNEIGERVELSATIAGHGAGADNDNAASAGLIVATSADLADYEVPLLPDRKNSTVEQVSGAIYAH